MILQKPCRASRGNGVALQWRIVERNNEGSTPFACTSMSPFYYTHMRVIKNYTLKLPFHRQLKSSLEKPDHTYWEVRAKSIDDVTSPMTSPASADSASTTFRRRRRQCYLDNPIDFCDIDAYNQWRLEDIVRAGRLLHKPPLSVSFSDEYEMRKVYSMIYDVYRCKYRRKRSQTIPFNSPKSIRRHKG